MKSINIRGQQIAYNTQDLFYQQVQSGIWEGFTFDTIDRFFKPGGVFIDIGAWNGIFSVYASAKGATSIACEPDPAAFDLAKNSLKLNNSNSILTRFAISDEIGLAQFNNMSPGWGNSESSLVDRGVMGATMEVSATTLEHFIKTCLVEISDVFLIKMDIEGGEIDVLKQSKAYITQRKPNFHISFHPAWIKSYDDVMYLFDLYNVVSDKGSTVTADNFTQLLDNHEHAFAFTAK
jgi:FkbM family methyltransferase